MQKMLWKPYDTLKVYLHNKKTNLNLFQVKVSFFVIVFIFTLF